MLLLLPLLAQKRSHHLVYRACPLFLFLSPSLSPRCTRLVRLVTDYSLWDTMVGRLNNSEGLHIRSIFFSSILSPFLSCFIYICIYIFFLQIYIFINIRSGTEYAWFVRQPRAWRPYLSPVWHKKLVTRKSTKIIPRLFCLWKEFYCRPSMRTCDRRAMCRILSLVAVLTRRTRKNYVDGTPLRNETTRLRVAGNELPRSRASSPRFVPCVSSRLQRDPSHSVWSSTNTEVPSSLSFLR